MANQPPTNKKPPSKSMFFGSIALFIISALLFGCIIKLNHRIDRTSGKVVETYTKRTFASRKQSTEREFLVVSYTINGKEYTGKTMRREGFSQDYVPVYYYPSFPGLAWFYKKANANIVGVCQNGVVQGSMTGASLGFLWYNAHPADIFMGDVGSLGLGGAMAVVAVLIKQEVLLLFIGGIFILEAASVILQVGSYKLRHGKRIFKMAPIHHHFEALGWAESKIIARFWIAGLVLALFALTTLKLR